MRAAFINFVFVVALCALVGEPSDLVLSKASPADNSAPDTICRRWMSGIPTCRTAIFSAGHFIHLRDKFKTLPGMFTLTLGYTGGFVSNPTYNRVLFKNTGHAEAVMVLYNVSVITFEGLARKFFTEFHDPSKKYQDNFEGPQYRAAVYAVTIRQKRLCVKVRSDVQVERSAIQEFPTQCEQYSRRFYFETMSDEELNTIRAQGSQGFKQATERPPGA